MSTTTQRKDRLTRKQEAFLDAYIANGFNASQAAITAGYKGRANTIGSRLLSKVDIQTAIAKKLKPLARRHNIDADRIIGRLTTLAFGTLRDVAEWGPDGVSLKPSADLTEEQAALVREVAETFGSDTRKGVRIKTHDQLAALGKLAEICNLVKQHEAPQQAQQVVINIIADGKPIKADIIDDDARPTDREAGEQGRSFAKPRANSVLARQN